MSMSIEEDVPPPVPPKLHSRHNTIEAANCPTCGDIVPSDIHDLADATRRIMELEAHIEFLKQKATAAADKCTEYEAQLRAFQPSQTPPKPKLDRSYTAPALDPSQLTTSPPRLGNAPTSRFSFLTGRRPPPPNQSTLSAIPLSETSDADLLNELERERTLRAKAEDRARAVDSEIEELSVQLFSEANEMVAEERRARAKLEERVAMLEKKDEDKAARLERLEKAVVRVARVKALLDEPDRMIGVRAPLTPPSKM